MKNLKGGYKIIDLQKNDLTSGFSVDGIYDAIEGSYQKPILVTGIVISDVEKNDVFVTPIVSGDNYVLELYGIELTIADTDAVTVASGKLYNELDLSDLTFSTTATTITTDRYNKIINSISADTLTLIKKSFKIVKSGTYDFVLLPQFINSQKITASYIILRVTGYYERMGTVYPLVIDLHIYNQGSCYIKYVEVPQYTDTYNIIGTFDNSQSSGTATNYAFAQTGILKGTRDGGSKFDYFIFLSGTNASAVFGNMRVSSSSIIVTLVTVASNGTWTKVEKTLS